jgi:hypothetical protein
MDGCNFSGCGTPKVAICHKSLLRWLTGRGDGAPYTKGELMDNHQASALAAIGGEPLDSSGFEAEKPAFEEEVRFETPSRDQEVKEK